MDRDRHWCDGCRDEFPLKRLKSCGACRTVMYCSAACQVVGWKDGHKKDCREIVVQKNVLKGWAHSWNLFFCWATACALDLTNKPKNYLNHCFEVRLRKTGSVDPHRAYEILSGKIIPLQVDNEAYLWHDPNADKEGQKDRISMVLIVFGEEGTGKPIDCAGFSWELPERTHDTPERSERRAKCCMEVMKSVVEHSKPRRAIEYAATIIESDGLLMRGELEGRSVDHSFVHWTSDPTAATWHIRSC